MAEGPRADDDHGQALALATELHAIGDSARALELLPELVAARPDDLAVRLLLARCLTTAAGSPAVALAAAEAAVACDPTSWEAQALLSRAALVTDPETAAVAAERAVLLAPGEPEALRARAAVQAARTEAPEADGSSRRGSIGLAALGLRPSTPVTARPEPADLEPRLVPRLPAALDPARAPSPPDRIDHAESALTAPPTPPRPADAPLGPRPARAPQPAMPATPAPANAPLGPHPDTPTVPPPTAAAPAMPGTPAGGPLGPHPETQTAPAPTTTPVMPATVRPADAPLGPHPGAMAASAPATPLPADSPLGPRPDTPAAAPVMPATPRPAGRPLGPRPDTPTAPAAVVPSPRPGGRPLGPRAGALVEPSLAKDPAPLPQAAPGSWPGLDLGAPGAAPTTREAPLPVALGGAGLAGSRTGDEKKDDDAQKVGGFRLAIRVAGLLTWLYMGFRVGVQAVGGPVGIGLFLLVVAGVAFLSRQLLDRS